ncbi:DUF6290 family protein [Ezakiella peruensis]|nr:DUF1778 domain-containing protein [Ezakiella peruensis]
MTTRKSQINIRLYPEEKKLVEEAAEKDSRTVSDFCRLIILEAIKKDAGK